MAQGPQSSPTAPPELAGRRDELAALIGTLSGEGPTVTFIHGIGGIGKTTLLRAFMAAAETRGVHVVFVDGRSIEPTEQGFLRELAAMAGCDFGNVAEACLALRSKGSPIVIVVDTYELLRLIDTWLRQSFASQLPRNVRLVLAGREPPVGAWTLLTGSSPGFQHLGLDLLQREDAIALLASLGIPLDRAESVYRVTLGHPLAVRLAASAIASSSLHLAPQEAAAKSMIEGLARVYLDEVSDTTTRDALFAASVVRRTTTSLLRAMLPAHDPTELFACLRGLPFTELARDGLIIHDSVQHAVAALLEAIDPVAHVAFRRAAANQLLSELRETGNAEAWRYTSDLLYLIQQPVIREAFFPRQSHNLAIEPARSSDADAIASIVNRHEEPESAAALLLWWDTAPWAFSVARNHAGGVDGFCIILEAHLVPRDALLGDPVTASWVAHLAEVPMQPQERSIMCRRWMSVHEGEGFSAVQAALWRDLKRTYLEMRPNLRRVYGVAMDMAGYGPVLSALGFVPLDECHRTLDGNRHHMAMLDFGPHSTDGWLQNHLRRELGLPPPHAFELNAGSRELMLDGEVVALTRLECGVLELLSQADGPVPRDELVSRVWGYDYDGGSNVVDVIIAALRRKLGDRAAAIETIRGVGYRLRVG